MPTLRGVKYNFRRQRACQPESARINGGAWESGGSREALRRLSLGVPQHDVIHPAVLWRPRDVGSAAMGGERGDGANLLVW